MAGQLRVDEITDEAGTGSPSFPQKITPGSLGTGTPDGTNFLRGDGAWATAGSTPGQLEILQEDIFTTSGTFTKATGFDDDDTVMIFLVGGGASGGAAFVTTNHGAASGGSGAAVFVLAAPYSEVLSSFNFTIGAGGAAVTRTTAGAAGGLIGGDSAILNFANNFAMMTASGGLAGQAQVDASFTSVFVLGVNITFARGVYADTPTGSGIIPPTTVVFSSAAAASAAFVVRSTEPTGILRSNTVTNITQFGGSAARVGATDRPFYNDIQNPALFTSGGLGSGTANGQDATGIGSGGGGCCRQSATAVSGAGGSGGLIVRYYRGRVAPEQVLLVGA